jgi:glycerol-3-phosphate acyltransferase PlsX
MGSDDHPQPEIEAAIEASRKWGDPILLVGKQELLQPEIDNKGVLESQVHIIHAPEILEMTDKPASAARGKALNSMALGMDLIKRGQADAFVTAGNTGGAMATALFRLGRIRGVKRPAVAVILPVRGGKAIVLDIGANADCKPEYLVQFATLGSIYSEKLFNKPSPRVALLSNGEEPGKGNMLVKETFPLLENAGVNFIGNIEPKELFGGAADVIVTDGFSGNVLIKTSESVALLMSEIIRDEIKSSPLTALGGLLAKPAFGRVGKMLDPSETGAAPLLGVDGLVFIGHGRSDAKALISAIRVAREAVANGLLEAMKQAIKARFKTNGKRMGS